MFIKSRVVSILLLMSVFLIMSSIPSFPAEPDQAENKGQIDQYRIGIGDILRINTWQEPDLTLEQAVVRSDGMITLPLVNDVKAQGMTTIELKTVLEKKLAEYVEAPNITVTLASPVSQRFYILGEVMRTGEYPITKQLTVMQAFALAGGFTEWASKNRILLIRRVEGKEDTITIKYKDILNGDFSKDLPLMADDTIIVP